MNTSLLRFELLIALWRYRGFMLSSIKRDFHLRYMGSLLGALWNIINPLAQIIIWTLIFAELMRTKLPGIDDKFAYSVYLCAGQLTWLLFSDVLSRMTNVFPENANLLKKSSFPRICLPVISLGTSLTNFFIIFGLFVSFLLITGRFPGIYFLAFFPVLALQLAFAVGLGVIAGTLNVFFRDVGHFVGVAVAFWFWLTPIVYPLQAIPVGVRDAIELNPMTPVVQAHQRVLLGHGWPDWSSLLPMVGLAIVTLAMAGLIYRRLAGEIVDEL